MDRNPRTLTDADRVVLRDLASWVRKAESWRSTATARSSPGR
jgi:hypothetical protein